MSRSAIAILSKANLLGNIAIIKQHAPNSKIVAMVKANAYGHGLRSVSKNIQNDVEMLGVASIDEAMILRSIGIEIPILLAEGVFQQDELLLASVQGFHVAFHNHMQLLWLDSMKLPRPINAWLKIDTGMGRLGFKDDDILKAYKHLDNSSNIAKPICLMSHFACADEPMHPLNQKQITSFNAIKKMLPVGTLYSMNNSAGIFNFPEVNCDFVRPGIALYGYMPQSLADGNTPYNALNLHPVMTLQTNLIAVKQMKVGDSIGYGARYCCPHDMLIGIVAFGYGDGYPRTAVDGTPILVNNKLCSIVGRVSMDMIAIDLTNAKDSKVGDQVTLWGNDLLLQDVAQYTSNCVYDMLTAIQHRVKFYWI